MNALPGLTALVLALGVGAQSPTPPKPIDAPDSVPAGGDISVTVNDGSDRIYIFNTRTKSITEHRVGADGKRTVPLPADALDRDVLIVLSGTKEGPKNGVTVEVRPAGN